MTGEDEIRNDTQTFYAMRYDYRTGQVVPADHRPGTPEAIRKAGFLVGDSPGYVPHQWLKDGFVDLQLSIEHPYAHQRTHGSRR